MVTLLFFLLMVKHVICDFALQGRFAHTHDKHKLSSVKGHLHALDHALGTALVFLFVSSWALAQGQTFFITILIFGIADYMVHFKIDWLKNNFVVANDMDKSSRQFWILTSVDQILHVSTYYVFVLCFDKFFF